MILVSYKELSSPMALSVYFSIICTATYLLAIVYPLLWRHNGCDGVSNHQPHGCLLNRSFRPKSNKASKLRVTGLCVGNSQVTGEFPAQMANNAENVSIWWRHHVIFAKYLFLQIWLNQQRVSKGYVHSFRRVFDQKTTCFSYIDIAVASRAFAPR